MKRAKRFQRGGRRFLRSAEGVSAVELALVMPVLLMMVCGIMDFGNIYLRLNVASEAAREGARKAAVTETPAQTQSTIQTFIQSNFGSQLTVTMTPATITRPIPSGTTINVTVTVDNPITFYTPIISNLISSYFPGNKVSGRCVMQVEG